MFPSSVSCHVYPCLSDNIGVLVRDQATDLVAIVDVPDEAATHAAIEQTGWTPTHIFLTHHHHDHVAGVDAIQSAYDVAVIGNVADRHRLPTLSQAMTAGETFALGHTEFTVVDTPGHTIGHIAFVSSQAGVAFVGDTLFAMGCGRLFEGSAAQMYTSLQTLAALPDETRVYCGHEYTLANLEFALSVDTDNADLRARADTVREARAAGRLTIPTTIGLEKATNPFVRARDKEHFADLRAAKDRY